MAGASSGSGVGGAFGGPGIGAGGKAPELTEFEGGFKPEKSDSALQAGKAAGLVDAAASRGERVSSTTMHTATRRGVIAPPR